CALNCQRRDAAASANARTFVPKRQRCGCREAFSTEPKMLIAATAGARNCFFMLVSTFRKWNSFPETVKAVFLPNLPIRTDQVDHAQIITATTKNVVFSQHRRCQFQFLRHPA